MNNNKGTALITGASSGIGAVYADRLAKRGFDLILVARNRSRLEALATQLIDKTGRSVSPFVADLTNKTDVARVEQVLKTDSKITMLVNNAGFGAVSPLLQSDVEKMDEMVSLNIGALMRLTYAAVPGFVERDNGTIINISSIVAVHPELLNGVYGATKAFVLALTQSLHHELASTPVRVQAVLPGATSTEFWDIGGKPVEELPAEIVMSATDMVDAALSGLDMGELVTLPALPDVADWHAYEHARKTLMPNLSRAAAAERFLVAGNSTKSSG